MKRFIGLLPILLLLTTCTKDFEDLNTNENAPSSVQPELLLRQVIYGYGDAMSYEGFVAGNLLSQHFSMIDFNLFDRHALNSPQEGGNPWPILYTALRDNETILELSRANPAQAVYEGPALVMKAYLTMTLTDMYGDVPYFEAFQGRATGVTTPRYDAQEDIYLADGGILDNLEKAVAAIDGYTGAIALGGDILFDGDLEGWVRFANSLRIKAIMRISGRVAPDGTLQDIFDEGRYINAPDRDATFAFTAGQPNNYPLSIARIGIFNVFLMSATAEEILAPLADPRTAVLYRPTGFGAFTGIANGIDASSGITPDNFARPGLIWRENSGGLPFNFMTSWETDFLLAEAGLKGYVGINPDEWYDRATIQAFRYWGTERPGGFLADPQTGIDNGVTLEQIITQKWIASIGNAYEGWAEWRRTGFPTNLRPAEASLNDNLIPVRMPYPSDEQALNFENYLLAVGELSGGVINSRVWWDVE